MNSSLYFLSPSFYLDAKGIHFIEAEITREEKIFREAVLQAMDYIPNYSRFNVAAGFTQFFCYKDGKGEAHFIQHYTDGVDYDPERNEKYLLMEKIQQEKAYKEIPTYCERRKSMYLTLISIQQVHTTLRN